MSLPRRPQAWQSLQKLGLAISFAVALLAANVASAKGPQPDATVGTEVAVTQLPAEARLTYRLIRTGGPFPYQKDGTVFGNRERLLPSHPRGFYREYTVARPRARNRGARRIVCGGRQAKQPVACYYTADHYASFKRIVP